MLVKFTVVTHTNKDVYLNVPDGFTDEDIKRWARRIETAEEAHPDVVMAEVIEWRKCWE